MSLLATAQKPANKPAIVTIAGEAGVGKTRLAATWPRPIFIRAEDGMQSIPFDQRPDAFPLLSTVEDVPQLWRQLMALLQEDHEYKTLVIDSITALETLFIEETVASDPKNPKSINQALGGYGAGLRKVASDHYRVRKAAGLLRDRKGMHVVFLAHTDTETVDPPDGDSYTRLALRLGSRSQQPYIDDVDVVGMLRLQSYRRGAKLDDRPSKAFSDGTRVLSLGTSVAHVSKNRFGISEDLIIPEGQNPLLDIINGGN